MEVDITPNRDWQGSEKRIALHQNYVTEGTGEKLVLDLVVGRDRVRRFEPSGYVGSVEERFDVDEILRAMAEYRSAHPEWAFYANVGAIDEIMRERETVEIDDGTFLKFRTVRLGSGTGTSFLDAIGLDGLRAARDDALEMLESEDRDLPIRIEVYETEDRTGWGAENWHVEISPESSPRIEQCYRLDWSRYPDHRTEITFTEFLEETGLGQEHSLFPPRP